MGIACWIHNTTNTQAEYPILIAFPLQQWSHTRISILHLYVRCLSFSSTDLLYTNLILYMFHAINIHKKVYYQQTALVYEYRTIPVCFGYYL